MLGDIKTGGKKALFLRTYTKDVSLFLTDETNEDAGSREKLIQADVKTVGQLGQICQATEKSVIVRTQRGESHEVELSTPLSVASFALIWRPD